MQHGERGFTYVWVLACIAVLGWSLAAAGPLFADAARRDREQELLRIGALYAQAIAAYRQSSPGSLKQYPMALDELLLDARYLGVRRHLRELYTDPVMPGRPFALVRGEDGRIRGVYSTSRDAPLRREPPALAGIELPPAAASYADWKFVPKEKT